MRPLVAAALACVAAAVIVIAVGVGDEDTEKPQTTLERPLVTVPPPQRDFGATMDYARSPNLIVTTPGTDSGLPEARVFKTVRFSVDGKLIKTRTAPPYSVTNLPSGAHVLTVTGAASGGDNARIQESYIK